MTFGGALSATGGGASKCKFEMINLDVTGASSDSIEIAIDGTATEYDIFVKPKGSDAWATYDYRAAASGYNLIAVGGLNAGTEYQIKVAAKNAGVECDIIGPVTYKTVTPPAAFDLNYRNWFSAFPANVATVAAFYDNTVVERSEDGGETWEAIGTLQAQDAMLITPQAPKTTLQGTMLRSRMSTPIGVNGRMGTAGIDATDTTWITSDMTGTNFLYFAVRENPQQAVIAAFEPLTYELRSGDGSVVLTGFVDAGGFEQIEFNYIGTVIITTSGLAGVVHWSGRAWDGDAVFPAAKSLLGVASSSVRLVGNSLTNVLTTYTEGAKLNQTIDAATPRIVPPRVQSYTGSQTGEYRAQAVYIYADQPISAQSAADGSGGNVAKAVPSILSGTRTILPFLADWLKIAALTPFTVDVTYPDGSVTTLVSVGGVDGGPFEQYIGPRASIPVGTYIEARDGAKIVAWSQSNTNSGASAQDETSLFMEK